MALIALSDVVTCFAGQVALSYLPACSLIAPVR